MERGRALLGEDVFGIGKKDVFALVVCEVCVEDFADRAGHGAVRAKEHAPDAEFCDRVFDLPIV